MFFTEMHYHKTRGMNLAHTVQYAAEVILLVFRAESMIVFTVISL